MANNTFDAIWVGACFSSCAGCYVELCHDNWWLSLTFSYLHRIFTVFVCVHICATFSLGFSYFPCWREKKSVLFSLPTTMIPWYSIWTAKFSRRLLPLLLLLAANNSLEVCVEQLKLHKAVNGVLVLLHRRHFLVGYYLALVLYSNWQLVEICTFTSTVILRRIL